MRAEEVKTTSGRNSGGDSAHSVSQSKLLGYFYYYPNYVFYNVFS